MARPSRTRTSRVIVSAVVLTITVGAILQFRKVNRAKAAFAPPTVASAIEPSGVPAGGPVGGLVPAAKTEAGPQNAPVKPVVAIAPQPVQPLITQTPDPTKLRSNSSAVPPIMWATNTASTASPVTPVANTSSAKTEAAGDVLSQAKTLLAGGDLLGARKILNDALLTGSLSAADTDSVKKQMADINQTIVFSARPFPKDPLGGVYVVKSGDRMAAIGASHAIPFELLLSLNHMTDARKLRYGQNLKVINGPFHVVVTKSKFTLDVYLGSPGGQDSTYITTFMVGLGTSNSTPTGTWIIKNKVTHPAYFSPEGRSGGVIAPDDPKNPLGPYWLGLEGTDGQAVGQRSYGIHGTIEPDSIGKMSSMGCIRLHNEDVEVVYKLLVPGKSTVIVKD